MANLPPDLDFTRDPDASPARMNRASGHLHARLRALEAGARSVDQVLAGLQAIGLQRLTDAITPVYEQLVALAQLGAVFTAASSSPVTLGLGSRTFVIAGADRERFAAAAYLGAQATGDPSRALYGPLVGYDREAGKLVMEAEQVLGILGDVVTDWTISAQPTPPAYAAVWGTKADLTTVAALASGSVPPDLPPRRGQFLAALEASGSGRTAALLEAVDPDPGSTSNRAYWHTVHVSAGCALAQLVKAALSLSDEQLASVISSARSIQD